tara:strand:- start:6 stop:635 length:630 start_codon:yes stop_codon:yes gene_type:complete
MPNTVSTIFDELFRAVNMTILRRLTSLIALACLVSAVSANDLVEKKMAGAEAGDADSQHMRGWMYENGVGVEEDNDAALIWYRKAALEGHEGAKADLNVLLAQRPSAVPSRTRNSSNESSNGECWVVKNLKGYGAYSHKGYEFDTDSLPNTIEICLLSNGEVSITGSDTKFTRVGESAIVGFAKNNGLELVETYQIDWSRLRKPGHLKS